MGPNEEFDIKARDKIENLLNYSESRPLIALLGLMLASSIISPYFFTSSNLTTIMSQTAVNTTAALGIAMIILMGSIDLSVGSQIGWGCMLTATLLKIHGFSIPMMIFTVILVGSAISVLNGILVVKGKLPSFIVTLASMSAVRGAIYLYNPYNVPIFNETFLGFSETISGFLPKLFFVIVIIAIFFIFLEKQSELFLHVQAIGSNEKAVRSLGIDADKAKILVFFFAGILYSIAGIMMASRLGAGYPNAAYGRELTIIAAAVVGGISLSGGKGTFLGAVTGAILLSTIVNIMTLEGLSTYWQMVVEGIVIAGAAIVYRGDVEFAK